MVANLRARKSDDRLPLGQMYSRGPKRKTMIVYAIAPGTPVHVKGILHHVRRVLPGVDEMDSQARVAPTLDTLDQTNQSRYCQPGEGMSPRKEELHSEDLQ